MVKSLFHLYFRSSHHLYFIFLSRVKINSINWPAPNIWVFIAQLVEHCSANAEAMGSNPVEALKFFSGLNLQLLKLRLQLRWSNLYFDCIQVSNYSFDICKFVALFPDNYNIFKRAKFVFLLHTFPCFLSLRSLYLVSFKIYFNNQ